MPKPYTPNDAWSRKAAEEGYRARSVYKLMELDERFSLLRNGMTVLDLGAAPGSWLQYVSKKIGPKGKAIGIDLTPIEPIDSNVETFAGDINDAALLEKIFSEQGIAQFDLVLSDIAPSTSGVKDVDQWRSVELVRKVLEIALKHLKPGGFCVVKIFRGADFDDLIAEVKRSFKQVRVMTVEASRDRSREVYIVMKK